MNRARIGTCLTGLGAAGAVAALWPTSPAPERTYAVRIVLPPTKPAPGAWASGGHSTRGALTPATPENGGDPRVDSIDHSAISSNPRPRLGNLQSGPFLPLDFDLADSMSAPAQPTFVADSVQTEKRVSVSDVDVGKVTVHATSESTLLLIVGEIAALLEKGGEPDLAESLSDHDPEALISFDDLRSRGVSIRYDAAGDRILLAH